MMSDISKYNQWLIQQTNWELCFFAQMITTVLLVFFLYDVNKKKNKYKKYVRVLAVILCLSPLIAGIIKGSTITLDYNKPEEYVGVYIVENVYTAGKERTPYVDIYLVDRDEKITLLRDKSMKMEVQTYYGKLVYAKHIKSLYSVQGERIEN